MKAGRWTVKGELDRVEGQCTRCKRPFPAIGLVPVDQWVPVRGGGQRHIIGWFCAGCRPRQFGRINGKPSDGWVEAPLDGSDLDQESKRGMKRMLDALGTTNLGPNIRTRNRKPAAMKPLNGGV